MTKDMTISYPSIDEFASCIYKKVQSILRKIIIMWFIVFLYYLEYYLKCPIFIKPLANSIQVSYIQCAHQKSH